MCSDGNVATIAARGGSRGWGQHAILPACTTPTFAAIATVPAPTALTAVTSESDKTAT